MEELTVKTMSELIAFVKEASPAVYDAAVAKVYANIASCVLAVLFSLLLFWGIWKYGKWISSGAHRKMPNDLDEFFEMTFVAFLAIGGLTAIILLPVGLFSLVENVIGFDYAVLEALTQLVPR